MIAKVGNIRPAEAELHNPPSPSGSKFNQSWSVTV